MTRYLDPKNDLVFKKIFGEHPLLLKSFLNAVLPLPDDRQIVTLEYLPTEQVPVVPCMKRPVVDVRCKDQYGQIFIVEMQMEWTDSFMQRLLFNTASAYVRQLAKGEQYDLLNPVYGLALINNRFDPIEENWYHHYGLIKVGSEHGQVIQGLTLVFVELPKFPITTPNAKQLKILWLRFMRELTNQTTVISPDLLAIPEIKQAIALAEESAYTSAELDTYDRYWDSISAEKTLIHGKVTEAMKKGLEQGLARGLEQGREEGKREEALKIARSLKKSGMSDDEIKKMTGFSLNEIIGSSS